ncbi:hypothetical protein WME98_30625 [Sorangium sp. So ce296]|uniref:ORC-CDC6 family AAA ATPase n=1 Tax=Sorangium sp. So ce296 TaxID=3133296 RepID=UPI003F5EF28B
MRKNLPSPAQFLGQPVPGHAEYVVADRLGSGCNAHVFVARSATLAREIACKVVPVTNLIGADLDPPTWQQEIHKANRVPSNRVVKFYGWGTWPCAEGDCVFLLSDLVRGQTLREYQKKGSVTLLFVLDFFKDMLDFLRELQELDLQHGDFHAGNVLIEDRSASFVAPPYGFRVTDFGVAPMTSGATLLDDFDQLGLMLRDLLARVDYQTCSPEDRYMFDILNDDFLAKGLFERDAAHDERARNPRLLFESLRAAQRTFAVRTAGVARRALSTPFDYLSCEQIGESHALLKELYSDKMLGLRAIEDTNNLVLTGPRGCGKTTVFRSLSLKHRFYTEDDAPSSVSYIGIYYRCDDLYFNFPQYTLPARAGALDVPLHFVTATLVVELLESLGLWLSRYFPQAWQRDEANVARELWTVLGLKKPQQPSADTFAALQRALGQERERAAKKQRFVDDPSHTFGQYFGPGVLPAVCSTLSQHILSLEGRPIFFFFDDYSKPKISADLQRNLNRLLMQRSAACFFKLATESPASYESSDADSKSYVEGREFRLANLGIDFINAESDDKLRFVDDVFSRRFRYTKDYPISSLEALVGDEPNAVSHNETARAIREGRYPKIWGRRALGELCSGDVHFLIELVGKMVTSAGGPYAFRGGTSPAVVAEVQNKVIRAEAGNFLRNLRALPTGQALVEVVEAFGNVASSHLRFKDSKNETSSPPHQASRIEPYEDPHLTGKAKEVYDDLLRYSVFIEDVRGRSRRGNVVPRLYLRRFLIPFFNLTFSRRDSLELSVDDFKDLLLDPKAFEAKKRLKSTTPKELETDDASAAGARAQLSLIDLARPPKA